MIDIPLTVCAKNEAASLGDCLDSLRAAVDYASARLPLRFVWQVVLDDCTDDSAAIVRARGLPIFRSSGGKVAAQRLGAQRPAPFRIYSDGDILVDVDTLHALCQRLLDDATVEIVAPPKRPVLPRSRSLLARALYLYNLRRGFAPAPAWFSGKLFAIRHWEIPTAAELHWRVAAAADADDDFYQLPRGLLADDVYLSRLTVFQRGPAAIAHTKAGCVHFAPPETLLGMYRYYRRMRREIERVDRLFPETRAAHTQHGVRRTDAQQLQSAPIREQALFALFGAAMAGCRALYRIDRIYHRHLAARVGWSADEWAPVAESKRPLSVAS